MPFSWKDHPRPILALAPMAGYTDSAYRQLIKEIEPRTICFTEFTSADGIVYDSKNTLRQLDFNPDEERPLVAQIFGKKPEHFTEAAKRIEAMGIDAIDLNMGCPAKKMVSSDHGSALLKNPELALKIIEATVKGTSLPVSVKTRIGTNQLDLPWFIQFCKDIESAGASLITIHGRTAKQAYTGLSDWEPIYRVKEALGIPVIGNGDIRSAKDAVGKLTAPGTYEVRPGMLEVEPGMSDAQPGTVLDGIMVGRGTMGNPWVMREIAAALFSDPTHPSHNPEDAAYVPPKTFTEKLPTILHHCELIVKVKGEERGIKEMRKHFVSLLKGFDGASKYRAQVVQISTLEETRAVLQEVAGRLAE